MKEPKVNIGQSQFQDTFMVIGDETTPYRKLRKLELQIRELKESLKMNEFAIRKTNVKISRLKSKLAKANDDLERIELEELEYTLTTNQQLIDDAESRLANFNEIKRQLLEGIPDSYWEQGFENAEAEHWISYFSRRAALEIMGQGRISTGTLDQITKMPDEIAVQIMQLIPHQQKNMLLLANVADEESKKVFPKEEQKQLE